MTDSGPNQPHIHAAQSDPLDELLIAPTKYERLLGACRTLVDRQLAQKSFAVRTAVRLAERAKPGLIEQTLRELLPGFVGELKPFYTAWRGRGDGRFSDYLVARDTEVADALLVVADRRIAPVQNRPIRAGYERLRHRAEREVIAVVPAVAAILAKQVDEHARTAPARQTAAFDRQRTARAM